MRCSSILNEESVTSTLDSTTIRYLRRPSIKKKRKEKKSKSDIMALLNLLGKEVQKINICPVSTID